MSAQFLIANHKGRLRPVVRLPFAGYVVRDVDDGYAEHGADVAIATSKGALLIYVGREAPPVGDGRYPAIAQRLGYWHLFLADVEPWRWRRAQALTPAGILVEVRINELAELGAALWPSGLQEAEYQTPTQRLAGAPPAWT